MKYSMSLLFLVSVFFVKAQEEADKIFWKKDGLTWGHFEASPDETSSFHANTNAGLSYSWGLKNINGVIELEYEVKSYFNPKGSWVRKGSQNDHLLQHEQLHFDITELHARKLKKQLAEVKVNSLGQQPREVLNRYYKIIDKERTLMQQKYDRETRHSIDKDAQARWHKYIANELNKYNELT
ncbi:DUF922 domain-containing protein [Antarcticibacterium arcticum]|uniref:DUF922 domain-containing protein n=1 Tax=Antarcticibacterium arcticum TaxID=2585771 RepID=A0A5B8YI41_9FLAO|nr:DUF922 domain-containing protein [Antarcticibacterium arcticum]QED37494.1 DUF922 domain-containing protein [Antarcticibacterium arcticum]